MIYKHILLVTFLNTPELIFFWHTVKWFQVLPYNSYNLTSVNFGTQFVFFDP